MPLSGRKSFPASRLADMACSGDGGITFPECFEAERVVLVGASRNAQAVGQAESLQRPDHHALRQQILKKTECLLLAWQDGHDKVRLRRHHGKPDFLETGSEVREEIGLPVVRS